MAEPMTERELAEIEARLAVMQDADWLADVRGLLAAEFCNEDASRLIAEVRRLHALVLQPVDWGRNA